MDWALVKVKGDITSSVTGVAGEHATCTAIQPVNDSYHAKFVLIVEMKIRKSIKQLVEETIIVHIQFMFSLIFLHVCL